MNIPETIKLASVFQLMAAQSQAKQAKQTESVKLAACMEVLSEHNPVTKQAAHPIIEKLRAAIGLGGGRTTRLSKSMGFGGKAKTDALRANSVFGQQISDPRRLAATAGIGGVGLGAGALGAGNAMFGTSNEETGRQAAMQAALAMQQQLNDRPWYSRLGDVFGGTNALDSNPYLANVIAQYR